MTANRTQALSGMPARQKAIIGVLVLVGLFVLWEVFGSMGGGKPAPQGKGMTPGAPQMPSVQPAQLIKQPPVTDREAALIKLQQETEAKYLSALNELQMLKVQREIAETNQAIMSAKLSTVKAERDIVDAVSGVSSQAPVTGSMYGKNLLGPGMPQGFPYQAQPAQASQPVQPAPVISTEVTYTVVSVTEIQHKWMAVIGAQGNLYNVSIGDILPADGSKVIAIDRSGVILQKGEEKHKVSLVPII